MQAFIETVTERFAGHIVASDVRLATEKEIEAARKLHEAGKCPHNIVVDEKGWLYDYRSCFVCGCGLGTV